MLRIKSARICRMFEDGITCRHIWPRNDPDILLLMFLKLLKSIPIMTNETAPFRPRRMIFSKKKLLEFESCLHLKLNSIKTN